MGDVKITELSIVDNQITIQYTPGSSPSPNPGPKPSPSPTPKPSPKPSPGPIPSPKPIPGPGPVPSDFCKSGTVIGPNYSTIAKQVCESVKDWVPTTKEDYEILSGKGSLQNYTATDLAKVWTVGTKGLKKKGAQQKDGGYESCIDAITVSLGECQAFASPVGPTTGGCSMTVSNAINAISGTRSGGVWQVSGPLSYNPITKQRATCPGPVGSCPCLTDNCLPIINIGSQEYDCQKHYKNEKDFWGPVNDKTNFVDTPVCQARLAYSHAQNGCGADEGNKSMPPCNDNTMSSDKPGKACWAGPLCITGQPASMSGSSGSANGWTNSYGHYFKSCCNCDNSACHDGLTSPWDNCENNTIIE